MDVCFHCGDECTTTTIKHQSHCFCCYGCKTVFDILNENDLSYYYELETSPGSIPSKYDGKFDYLKNETIAQKLLEFDELSTKIVSFVIPSIHCSSCIWILENLNKLNPDIKTTQEFDTSKIKGTIALYRPSNQQLDFELPLVFKDRKLHIPDKNLIGGRWNITIEWIYQDKAFMYKEKIVY